MEISLNIDENRRTISSSSSFDHQTQCVSLNYSTQTMAIHIQESVFSHLLQDCEKIVTDPILPWTYWIPCNAEPRLALEKLALTIFHHHIPHNYKYDTSNSGVEWWIQMRPTPPKIGRRYQPGDETESISFHWDKDEDLRTATGGLFIHPHLSTVTYLTSIGAPTVIFNSKVGNIETGEPNLVPHIDAAFISWPGVGKHLVFDGALLHGVPSELLVSQPSSITSTTCSDSNTTTSSSSSSISSSSNTLPRITFLVNIWLNYRPLAIQPFPVESLVHGYLPTQELQNVSFTECPIQIDEVVYDHDTEQSDCVRFEWSLGGPVVIQANLPVERIHTQSKVGGNTRMEWKQLNGVQIVTKEDVIVPLK